MMKQKQLRSCRSKSAGRQSSGELVSPISYANAVHSKERQSRSPAQVGALPGNVNITSEEVGRNETVRVSSNPSTEGSDNQTNKSLDVAGQSVMLPKALNIISDQTHMSTMTPGVSDNGAAASQESSEDTNLGQPSLELAKQDPGQALLLVLAELKEIRSQMVKLHQVESTTASLVGQLATNTSKMGELVETVSQNKANIHVINEGLEGMKNTMESHRSQLANLKHFKEEVAESNDQAVTKMNELIDIQRDQVDSFNAGAKQLRKEWKKEVMVEAKQLQKEWKKEVMVEVSKKLEEIEKEKEKEKLFQSLKDQAFRNRYNLVLVGLAEDPEKTTSQIVKNFFVEVMQVPKVKFISAHRLGSQTEAASSYNRPILIKFSDWVDRKAIWGKRAEIPDKKIRIQADLPKILREGIPTLYKVASAASKSKEFSKVKVQNYQLELDGKSYQISDLEQLPEKLRPSSLAELKSESHLVFFSRHSKLSNHHPSQFTIKGQVFSSMEQFLAMRRAELSGKEESIKKAREAQDPVQAKHVLNSLHGDHQQEWDEAVGRIALEGLRAKFFQNHPLQDHLCGTGKLVLGEASTNARWGIGMDINNEEVLDQSKWLVDGNLLGRSLMTVRADLLKKKKKAKQ